MSGLSSRPARSLRSRLSSARARSQRKRRGSFVNLRAKSGPPPRASSGFARARLGIACWRHHQDGAETGAFFWFAAKKQS